jgi:3-oxoacyl-[acyl-carrier protein] reductase
LKDVNFDFTGTTVLVTGGSKGIGRSIAESFLEAQAEVVVCARGKGELDDLSQIKHRGRLLTVVADATKEADVSLVLEKTVERFGKLDVLVNNVGGAIKFCDFYDSTQEDWSNAFELNVMSVVNFSKESIPWLKKSRSPRIINISSISGLEPGFMNPHYTHCKSSVINISKYLSNFLAKEKILVNCVCPGTIETDSWNKHVKLISDVEFERQKIPLGRLGAGSDVASLVLFLSSTMASWITGSCFHVDGGKLRSMS